MLKSDRYVRNDNDVLEVKMLIFVLLGSTQHFWFGNGLLEFQITINLEQNLNILIKSATGILKAGSSEEELDSNWESDSNSTQGNKAKSANILPRFLCYGTMLIKNYILLSVKMI